MMVMILLLLVLSLVLNSSLAIWPRTLSVLVYTSLARSGNAVDPGTIISISHAEDLHWSQESLTLRQKRGQVVYHNYTVYLDSDGQQRTRWLKRQFLPGAKERANLQRRGFYRWKKSGLKSGIKRSNLDLWIATSQRGQYQFSVVPYCFEDINSKVMLGDMLDEAIDRWHTALGPRAGIRFMPNCQAMCGPLDIYGSDGYTEEGYSKSVLRIRHDESFGGGSAPIGCQGRRYLNVLELNPAAFIGTSDSDQDNITPVAAVAHELGHVLGLWHEHARPGAGKEIKIHCDRIPGYDEVKELVLREDKDIDVDEVCKNFDIALQFSPGFLALAFMPFPSTGPYGTESDGPLDRNSLMLYASADQYNVIMWKDPNDETNEIPILANHFPSAGDVAAVKVMYPDYVPPAGWHWDGDQVVEDGSQAIPPGNGPPAVPLKPSSLRVSKTRPSVPTKPTALRASKIRPSVPAKPSALRASSSTTSRPLSQIVHDAFATTGQKSPIDTATLLETIEN